MNYLIVALWFFCASAQSAVYTVSTSGSDSNSGSASAPWNTIGHSFAVAQAGDTVMIQAGTYNETPTISSSGGAGSVITFTGVGNPILYTSGNVFKVNGTYCTFNAITFHCANNTSDYQTTKIYVPSSTWCYSTQINGSHNTFNNCLWEDIASPAAHWGDSDHADYPVIQDNGSNNSIIGGAVRNIQDCDAFGPGFLGTCSNGLVKGVEIYNITNPNYGSSNTNGPHSDWCQDGGAGCVNLVFDSCYIHDCGAHIGVFDSQIISRNCLFVNLENGVFIGGSGGTVFENCTFYNAGYQKGAPTLFAGSNVKFINNIVYYSRSGNGSGAVSGGGGAISNNYEGGSPGFVNGSGGFSAATDFELSASSGARGQGAAQSPSYPDYLGIARSGTWDSGAFQFGSLSSPTPIIAPMPNPAPTATPTPSTKFEVGEKVVAVTTVNIRTSPAGAAAGTQPANAVGTIISGPLEASYNGIAVNWWNIIFTSGVGGYVGEDNLAAFVPSPTPTPSANPTATPSTTPTPTPTPTASPTATPTPTPSATRNS